MISGEAGHEINGILHPTAPQVFVSYSRADWHSVQRIVTALRDARVRPWVDFESLVPGQHWRQAIRAALDNSEALVFCLSALSLESVWAGREMNAARERSIPILPVMVDYVHASELPPELSELHIIDTTRLAHDLVGPVAARKIAEALGVKLEAPLNGLQVGPDHFDGLIIDLSAHALSAPDVSALVPIEHGAVERIGVGTIGPHEIERLGALAKRAGWAVLTVSETVDTHDVYLVAATLASHMAVGRLTIAQLAGSTAPLDVLAQTLRARHLRLQT